MFLFFRVSLCTHIVIDDGGGPGYIQVQRLNPPTWSEDAVRAMVDGRPQVKWRSFCSVDGVDGKFPREGHGVERGGEAPSFQNKKVSSSRERAEGSMNIHRRLRQTRHRKPGSTQHSSCFAS
jgi:hypothetical protein